MLKCLWYRPTRMHGDVCTTHLLRHWSRFAPSHAPHIAYAASGHQHHGLSSGRAAFAFLPKFCSQSASDLDCWEPQVRSGDIKAVVSHPIRLIVSQAWCAGALSCWKIKNSPEISCMTGSIYSVNSPSLILTPGSTNIIVIVIVIVIIQSLCCHLHKTGGPVQCQKW